MAYITKIPIEADKIKGIYEEMNIIIDEIIDNFEIDKEEEKKHILLFAKKGTMSVDQTFNNQIVVTIDTTKEIQIEDKPKKVYISTTQRQGIKEKLTKEEIKSNKRRNIYIEIEENNITYKSKKINMLYNKISKGEDIYLYIDTNTRDINKEKETKKAIEIVNQIIKIEKLNKKIETNIANKKGNTKEFTI